MREQGYNKTILIWSDKESDKVTLTKIIKGLKFHPIVFENMDNDVDVSKTRCFIIFARGYLVPSQFFVERREILNQVNAGELKFVFLDDDVIRLHTPPNSIRLFIANKDEIKEVIKKQAKEAGKFNKRRIAMKKQVGRLFYIYTQLNDKGCFSMKEIIDLSGISKRTFHRDIELINKILINRTVALDYTGNYSFKDEIK